MHFFIADDGGGPPRASTQLHMATSVKSHTIHIECKSIMQRGKIPKQPLQSSNVDEKGTHKPTEEVKGKQAQAH